MVRRAKSDEVVPVEDYEHVGAKRTNNPPVGLAHLDREETPTRRLTYDPHLDPQLLWAARPSALLWMFLRPRCTCMRNCQRRRSLAQCVGNDCSSRCLM